MKTPAVICLIGALLHFGASVAHAEPPAKEAIWTDPQSALREDPDFAIQGEYRSTEEGNAIGAQVIALGNGKFDIFLLDGGLPGAGWEPKQSRTLLKGERKGDKVECVDEAGKPGGSIENHLLSLTTGNGAPRKLSRIDRQSPTLGAKAPKDALVLFADTSAEQWQNGSIVQGDLLAAGCTSIRKFAGYTLHLEFRTPYKPNARGQKRGNSGIYHSGRWETQILDSFGLDGKDNECGGIYSISKPRLNMCLPPLAWQTYDVEFTAAKFDASGKRTAWPRITVRLNGVPVHEDLELAKDFTTSAPASKPLENPVGPIFLQEHGNPVVFRNIWIVPGG